MFQIKMKQPALIFFFPLASRRNFSSSIQSPGGTEVILQGTLHEVRDCFNYWYFLLMRSFLSAANPECEWWWFWSFCSGWALSYTVHALRWGCEIPSDLGNVSHLFFLSYLGFELILHCAGLWTEDSVRVPLTVSGAGAALATCVWQLLLLLWVWGCHASCFRNHSHDSHTVLRFFIINLL